MIAKDQPHSLPSSLRIALSSKGDGTMLDRTTGLHTPRAIDSRRAFCEKIGVSYDGVVYQNIIYGEGQTYDDIVNVDASMTTEHTSDVPADALFTKATKVGLFLPVADCVATVVYDPVKNYLAMVHLGRDSTAAELMRKVIDKFKAEGSNPNDLLVWMSPSAKRETYLMQWFDQKDNPMWREFIAASDEGVYLDLPGFNKAACLSAGILETNIHISPINTMASDEYFSHSMGDTSGRFAVLAQMTA